MKNTSPILACALIMMVVGCDFAGRDNQSISFKKTEMSYRFKASYPERKTAKVLSYIENTLKNQRLFSGSADEKKSNIRLGDTLNFRVESGSGRIDIAFDKNNNSAGAYRKLDSLCIGIKGVLEKSR